MSKSSEQRDLERGSPFAQYEYVDMTFNSVANGDTAVPHGLSPETYEDIDFQVVRTNFTSAPAAAPIVYRDNSATRKAWGKGYVVLRANIASLRVTLLLTTRR